MNKTIVTISIALLMLGIPASAKVSSTEPAKPELGEQIGISNVYCPLGSGVITILDGQSISSSLPASVGASCEFKFTPAAAADLGRLRLSGMTSDFDLYVKKNAIPTTSSWDCRPYTGGTTAEQCDVGVNSGDYLGVMVRRWSGSGPFTLTASSIVVPTLDNGVPVAISLTGSGTSTLYKLVVPAGSSLANFALAPANENNVAQTSCQLGVVVTSCAPDADLYVRFGAIPTTSAYSCRPWTYGNVEACTFSTEAFSVTGQDPTTTDVNHVRPFAGPGKYFVMVRSFAGAPSVVLQGATA